MIGRSVRISRDDSGKLNLTSLQLNAVTIGVSIVSLLLGSFLAYIAAEDHPWHAVLLCVAGGLVAVGTLALITEVVTLRTVVKLQLLASNVGQDVSEAGIAQITRSDRAISYNDLFANAKKLDLIVVDNMTWLEGQRENLEELVARKNSRIRVLLPNPSNDQVMLELSKRLDQETAGSLKTKIEPLVQLLWNLRQKAESCGSGATVQLWLLDVAPTYSLYRLDGTSVLRTHEVQKERGSAPFFVCTRPGLLWEFANDDFNAVRKSGEAKEAWQDLPSDTSNSLTVVLIDDLNQ